MQRYLRNWVAIILLCMASGAGFSHVGGHITVPPEAAKKIAKQVVIQFSASDPGLSFGKLGESWAEIPDESVKVHVKGEGYYIISLRNEVESKTLYVLMSESGEVYDANFSGEFKALKTEE